MVTSRFPIDLPIGGEVKHWGLVVDRRPHGRYGHVSKRLPCEAGDILERHLLQSLHSVPTLRPRQHVAIGLDNPVRELAVPAHVPAYGEVPCRRAAETG